MPEPCFRLRTTASGWLCFALVVLMVGGVARAQPERLPRELLTESGGLSTEQLELIDAYVSGWARILARGESPERIAEARGRLIDPFRQRSEPFVRETIARATAEALRPAMEQDNNKMVRMNALIVASELPIGEAAGVSLPGLTDEAPANRYWAAKAIARLAERADGPHLDDEQQHAVLDALQQAMPAEQSAMVLEQMFRALGNLTVEEAVEATLDLLEQRVELHLGGISQGLRADEAAMSSLHVRLMRRQAQDQNVDEPVRRLTAIAAKYGLVVGRALNEGDVPEALQPIAVASIGSIERIFSRTLNHFDPARQGGPPLGPSAAAGDFDEMYLNMLSWVGTREREGLLTESQVAIPYEEMRPPSRAARPEPASSHDPHHLGAPDFKTA